MSSIWNDHTDTITTSRLQVTAAGLQTYRDGISSKDYLGIFEEDTADLLGFANVDFNEDHIYVNQMAIRTDRKRLGIGTQFMKAIKEMATDQQIGIKLAVQVVNTPAVNFFFMQGLDIISTMMEQEYVPADFDPSNIDELLRLVEHQMEWRPE